MRIAVLGAGLLGVSTAYYLAKDGHQVVVLERQLEPAKETSHATACLLTPGHTVAWAGPHAPWQLLASFWQKESALKVRLRPSWQLAKWSWRFLKECTGERYRANTLSKHCLAKYSLEKIGEVTREHRLSWDNVQGGVLYLERDQQHLRKMREELAVMTDAGVQIDTLDRDQLLTSEPSLKQAKIEFAGALRIPIDQSGDGRKFAIGLSEVCRSLGVDFRFGTSVRSFVASGGRIERVETDAGPISADAFVLCLGSYSPLVAASAGLDLPIYPVKGYSVTMPVLDAARAPLNGGIDEKTRVTFARLGDRVRMTTTAEFTGYDTSYSPANFAKILRVAHELFDGGIDVAKAFFWACLRPASPDGPPIIGATPVANLWLNTGHGYLGWTMSCGSAKILSDLIAGRSPEIDASPYRFSRF